MVCLFTLASAAAEHSADRSALADNSILFLPVGPRWRTHRKAMHSALSSTAVHKYKPIQLFESQRLAYNLLQDPDNYREAVERCESTLGFRSALDGFEAATCFRTLERTIMGASERRAQTDLSGRCFADTASVVLAVSYGRRVDGPHNPIVLGVTDLMSELPYSFRPSRRADCSLVVCLLPRFPRRLLFDFPQQMSLSAPISPAATSSSSTPG